MNNNIRKVVITTKIKFKEVKPIITLQATPYFKSNEMWQEEFKRIKSRIKPSQDRHISSRTQTPKSVVGKYKGETQYDMYKQFINGVLHFIQEGEIDFVYYIYQIEELLRYEPKLKTRYVRDKWDFSYFEVWV